MNILFIDDEEFLGDMVEAHLQHKFPEVTITHVLTCEDGLRALETGGFSLILLDLRLTGTSGMDCLRELRLRRPEIPVVILTGDTDDKLRSQALAAGADDLIQKTHMSRHLNFTVACAMNRRTAKVRIEAETEAWKRQLDSILKPPQE